jgi:hypothetical protein
MAYSPRLPTILDASRQQYRAGKWRNEEEFWSKLERDQASKAPAKARKKRA